METFHAPNYRIVEPKLDELEWMLGAKKTIMNFVVEKAIPAIAEVGYDGFVIDGKFADQSMFGIEVKDKGFVMECVRYDDLPISARSVNAKLVPIFQEYQSRGFFSTEIRVTEDGGAYLIDPCMRLGSPANELQQVLVKNYDDIIWEGAGGVVVEPECTAIFGAQLMLRSAWADKNWQPVEFPPSIRDFVKLHNMTVIDGRYYVVPQNAGIEYIGAVVATGDTMKEAIANCKAMAEKVVGYYVQVFEDSLDEAVVEYENLKEL